jgi:hypothetical protein
MSEQDFDLVQQVKATIMANHPFTRKIAELLE